MPEANIINRGRGPEIAGSRITVFDILDYLQEGWPSAEIARLFHLNVRQVEVAIRYIEDHKDDVMDAYQRILDRCARGNPPEIEAKLNAGHARSLAVAKERQRAEPVGERDAGDSR